MLCSGKGLISPAETQRSHLIQQPLVYRGAADAARGPLAMLFKHVNLKTRSEVTSVYIVRPTTTLAVAADHGGKAARKAA